MSRSCFAWCMFQCMPLWVCTYTVIHSSMYWRRYRYLQTVEKRQSEQPYCEKKINSCLLRMHFAWSSYFQISHSLASSRTFYKTGNIYSSLWEAKSSSQGTQKEMWVIQALLVSIAVPFPPEWGESNLLLQHIWQNIIALYQQLAFQILS